MLPSVRAGLSRSPSSLVQVGLDSRPSSLVQVRLDSLPSSPAVARGDHGDGGLGRSMAICQRSYSATLTIVRPKKRSEH